MALACWPTSSPGTHAGWYVITVVLFISHQTSNFDIGNDDYFGGVDIGNVDYLDGFACTENDVVRSVSLPNRSCLPLLA